MGISVSQGQQCRRLFLVCFSLISLFNEKGSSLYRRRSLDCCNCGTRKRAEYLVTFSGDCTN